MSGIQPGDLPDGAYLVPPEFGDDQRYAEMQSGVQSYLEKTFFSEKPEVSADYIQHFQYAHNWLHDRLAEMEQTLRMAEVVRELTGELAADTDQARVKLEREVEFLNLLHVGVEHFALTLADDFRRGKLAENFVDVTVLRPNEEDSR